MSWAVFVGYITVGGVYYSCGKLWILADVSEVLRAYLVAPKPENFPMSFKRLLPHNLEPGNKLRFVKGIFGVQVSHEK